MDIKKLSEILCLVGLGFTAVALIISSVCDETKQKDHYITLNE